MDVHEVFYFLVFTGCEPYHQYGNVGGIYPGNSTRLSKVERTDAVELFLRFQAQALDLHIIDVRGEKLFFQALCMVGLVLSF